MPDYMPRTSTRRRFLASAAGAAAGATLLSGCDWLGLGDDVGPHEQVLRARLAIKDAPNQAWEDTAASARRLDYVALHAAFTQAGKAEELKAAGGGCAVFAYQNWGFTGYEGEVVTGLHRPEVEERGWLARDPSGAPMENRGFPGRWLVDCGKPGYAKRWAEAVAEQLDANGGTALWDGVLMDDVNAHVALTEPHWPAGYASARDHYRRALEPAIREATGRLREHGYALWANLGGWHEFAFLDGLIPHFDVCMHEFFGSERNRTPQAGRMVESTRRSVARCAELGKVYLGVAQLAAPDDEATATYADMLARIFGQAGHIALAAHHNGDYGDEPWFEAFDLDTGDADGPAERDGSLYSRRWERGTGFANAGATPAELPDGSSLEPLTARLLPA